MKEVLKNRIVDQEIDTIQKMNDLIENTAKEILKKTYIRSSSKENPKIKEKPWMTEDIKKEIKERKKMNRMRRNSPENENLNILYGPVWKKVLMRRINTSV